MESAQTQIASAWTASEIRSRLGISTSIYQNRVVGAREIAAIRAEGIPYIELLIKEPSFDFHDQGQVAEVAAECRRQDLKVVSVHADLGLNFRSDDECVRVEAVEETLRTMRFAEEMGASVLVAHLGWNDQARRTAEELLERTEGSRVTLTTESMTGLVDRYFAIIDAIDSPRFGLTVDIGHVRDADGVNPFIRSASARETIVRCGKRIAHLHLHETFDLEKQADHRPPMHPDGLIQWGAVFAGLREIDYAGVLLFEDGRGENPEQWCAMTGAFPDNFVRRYKQPEVDR